MGFCRAPLFRKRQFAAEIIVTCVPWYLRFSLSLRDVEELMAERGLSGAYHRYDVNCGTRRISSLLRAQAFVSLGPDFVKRFSRVSPDAQVDIGVSLTAPFECFAESHR